MGRRIAVLFVVGVAVPSALLGYLAFRGVRNDEALFERDQQGLLQETARQVLASFEARISAVGRRAASSTGGVVEEPLIDAVFALTPDGRFQRLTWSHALFDWRERSPSYSNAGMSPEEEARLAVARGRELRETDFAGASAAYAQLLVEAHSERARAEALGGLARVARRTGDLHAAAEHYGRLIEEYGGVRSGADIPFALAARLELLAVLEASADVERAAMESAALLEVLLAGDSELSQIEYVFVADRVREAAERLAREMDAVGTHTQWADSLRLLLAHEDAERVRSARIRGFVATARGAPQALRGLVGRGDAGGRGTMLRGEGGPYPVYVLDGDVRPPGKAPTSRGLLLDPLQLEREAVRVVREVAGSSGLRWILTDESGAVRAAGSPGTDEEPSVLAAFPGRFPPLTLGLLPPPRGPIRSFFASPRSVYLYAFVLVVGILAGGLALTVRTLSHQLELARMQSDFVSTVSHELKSPLTSIRQLSEMLQAGRVRSEGRRQRYFDVLVEQSERLTALIDHVLSFARMDAGHAELDLVEVDLKGFLEDLVAEVQERVRHRGFHVRGEIDPDLPPVTMDPEAIALATTNLIDNAIKFSRESREVVVRAVSQDHQAAVTVQDFGVGLDPAEQDRVFERFYRGGDSLTRSVKGTGLGLTLVKQIVDAHGGSVVLESEPGRGAAFTMRLPVSGP